MHEAGIFLACWTSSLASTQWGITDGVKLPPLYPLNPSPNQLGVR